MLEKSAGSEGYALVVCYSFFFPKQREGILNLVNKMVSSLLYRITSIVAFELALHPVILLVTSNVCNPRFFSCGDLDVRGV